MDNFGSQNLFWGRERGGWGRVGVEEERSGGEELAEGNRPPGCLIVP